MHSIIAETSSFLGFGSSPISVPDSRIDVGEVQTSPTLTLSTADNAVKPTSILSGTTSTSLPEGFPTDLPRESAAGSSNASLAPPSSSLTGTVAARTSLPSAIALASETPLSPGGASEGSEPSRTAAQAVTSSSDFEASQTSSSPSSTLTSGFESGVPGTTTISGSSPKTGVTQSSLTAISSTDPASASRPVFHQKVPSS